MTAVAQVDLAALDDLGLAALAARRDPAAARLVMTRYNQRLYRVAWSILRNHAEAEDALQDGYLKAFAAIGRFAGQSSLGTWLTRIVINEAIGRRRSGERRKRQLEARGVSLMDDYRQALSPNAPDAPDAALARRQIAGLLEGAIAGLPGPLRIVLILRDVDELSVSETADLPFTRSTALCAGHASCTDGPGYCTDGTRCSGIIWQDVPRTVPRRPAPPC